MKINMRSAGLVLPILVGFALTPGVWSSTVSAGEGPKEISGFGEAKTLASIKFNKLKGGSKSIKSFGKKSLGAIGDVVGNRITFAFVATKDSKGKVQGQMSLTDHVLNLTITGDVASLKPHPKYGAPVGVNARGLSYPVRMVSSKSGSVYVNGKLKPTGWTFVNSPVFDGDKDAVCFELKNPDGKKVYQWIGFLSSGDVKTK